MRMRSFKAPQNTLSHMCAELKMSCRMAEFFMTDMMLTIESGSVFSIIIIKKKHIGQIVFFLSLSKKEKA